MDSDPRRRLTLASGGGEGRGARPPVAAPPDPALQWSAEVEWRREPAGSRFCLVARAVGSPERTVVAQSGLLEWPPTGAEAVHALSRAVEQLQSAAAAAGWVPAQQGRAWYAKRFTWQPVPGRPPPAAAAPAVPEQPPPPETRRAGPGRFERAPPWPEGTSSLYRCEIAWETGYVKAHFRALVFAPGSHSGTVACSSKTFKWLLMSDPDIEEAETEVRRLAAAMAAAGWEPAGQGADWFSHRFVWRHEHPPPERAEPPARADAGRDAR